MALAAQPFTASVRSASPFFVVRETVAEGVLGQEYNMHTQGEPTACRSCSRLR